MTKKLFIIGLLLSNQLASANPDISTPANTIKTTVAGMATKVVNVFKKPVTIATIIGITAVGTFLYSKNRKQKLHAQLLTAIELDQVGDTTNLVAQGATYSDNELNLLLKDAVEKKKQNAAIGLFHAGAKPSTEILKNSMYSSFLFQMICPKNLNNSQLSELTTYVNALIGEQPLNQGYKDIRTFIEKTYGKPVIS